MKRATLEATDENILGLIREQEKNNDRNQEIIEFIEGLERIGENKFISLDARWGEGKTFYVRQIEKTLEYQTLNFFKKEAGGDENIQDELEKLQPYFKGTELEKQIITHSYLPIYYDAWLYDNHSDPLMSLLLVISKKCIQQINTTRAKNLSERLGEIASSISFGLQFFKGSQISIDGQKVINAFKDIDILEEVKTAEELRVKVKQILNEVLVEQAEKLVIFVDELDRCRPSYALEMLERIKHYFDDDRIIFVISVNKEQLIYTISNYYGNGFDSTGYLNKFFDINVYVPPVKRKKGNIYSTYGGCRYFEAMIKTFSDYYRLSLRDRLIYEERMAIIDAAKSNKLIDDDTISGICASIFVPLIVILDMKDIEEKRRFINGESNIFEKFEDLEEVSKLYKSLGWLEKEENQWMDGKKKVEAVYQYAFQNNANAIKSAGLEINQLERHLKEMCIKLSGTIKDDRPKEEETN